MNKFKAKDLATSGAATLIAVLLTIVVAPATADATQQGPWEPPAADLSKPGQDARQPQIAFGPDGSATAVWSRHNGDEEVVQAAFRPARGSFGAPVTISEPGGDAISPQIAIGRDGGATAVWARFNGDVFVVQAAYRPPGGSFGPPEDLSKPDEYATIPQIALDPAGGATVVWQRGFADVVIQVTTRPPGGSFGPPEDL